MAKAKEPTTPKAAQPNKKQADPEQAHTGQMHAEQEAQVSEQGKTQEKSAPQENQQPTTAPQDNSQKDASASAPVVESALAHGDLPVNEKETRQGVTPQKPLTQEERCMAAMRNELNLEPEAVYTWAVQGLFLVVITKDGRKLRALMPEA